MGIFCLLAATFLTGINGVSGIVVDKDGNAVNSARVFMEPGIGGSLIETDVDNAGRFTFAEVPAGPVGFIGHANGYAFGGVHRNVSAGQDSISLRIVLNPPDIISGAIKNTDDERIEGARITRIALPGVGIPLYKLKAFGYEEPESDKRGGYTLKNVPKGMQIAMKVGHPDYAQEGVVDIKAGSKKDITLYRGVIVDGSVIQTASQSFVSQAVVLIKNAQPPHDTAIVKTDTVGTFALRLKPGVYMARAQGTGQSSAGWEVLTVTGETNFMSCRLTMAETGVIKGKLFDAVKGNPIEGARISLESNGNMADVQRTGPNGGFNFIASRGTNIIGYAATPGYLPPDPGNVSLELEAGKTITMPDMWLVPVPDFTLEVLDSNMQPVPGARVQLLQPRQYGWQHADEEGKLTLKLSNMGKDIVVAGFAESPKDGTVALFQLDGADSDGARVQLMEAAVLRGTITGARGKSVAGALVGTVFPGEDSKNTLLLWRILSDKKGGFEWPLLVPGAPQRLVAQTDSGKISNVRTIKAELSGDKIKDAGEIRIDGATSGISAVGDIFQLKSERLICGSDIKDYLPKVVITAKDNQIEYILEALDSERKVYARHGWEIAVITDNGIRCGNTSVSVYGGSAPSEAQTYLLDKDNRILMETFDLPPLSLLKAILPE